MKFKVGEIAIFIRKGGYPPYEIPYGAEIEIIHVGPILAYTSLSFPDGIYACSEDAEYGALYQGISFFADECDLRKRYQPGADICRSKIEWLSVDVPRETA